VFLGLPFFLLKPQKYASLFLQGALLQLGFVKDIQTKELAQSYHKAADSSLRIHQHFHVSTALHNRIYLCKNPN